MDEYIHVSSGHTFKRATQSLCEPTSVK